MVESEILFSASPMNGINMNRPQNIVARSRDSLDTIPESIPLDSNWQNEIANESGFRF
jgi:hypothetical protein